MKGILTLHICSNLLIPEPSPKASFVSRGLWSNTHIMGFINYIVNVVVQILPFSGNNGGLLNQQPLPINVPSSGVSFSPQLGNGVVGNVPQRESQITCHYPSLKGWEMCNGPDSRNCWLRETHSKQPVFSEYDITTDYEAKWPQGVTREVRPCLPFSHLLIGKS